MGVVRPVSPPRRALSLKVVALVATVAMVAAAFSTSVAMVHDESVSRARFAVTAASALVLLVYVLFLLQDLTWDVRLQNRRLVGWGLAGRAAVDLDRLTGAGMRSSERGSFVVPRDGAGSIMVELQFLRSGLGHDVAAALRRCGRRRTPAGWCFRPTSPGCSGCPWPPAHPAAHGRRCGSSSRCSAWSCCCAPVSRWG
jgi:hypothetical protein